MDGAARNAQGHAAHRDEAGELLCQILGFEDGVPAHQRQRPLVRMAPRASTATNRRIRPVDVCVREGGQKSTARPDGNRPSGPAGPTRRWNGADAPTELNYLS